MSSKFEDFFEGNHKNEKNQLNSKKKQVSFDDAYSLPKHVKSRDDVEKGFKDYLTHKEEDRRRGYISPPFEVSRVPSPIYGYHKPKKEDKKSVDYDQLKQDMKKETKDFIIYDTYVTQELENSWQKAVDKTLKTSKTLQHSSSPKVTSNKLSKKSYGLNRTLASIMEEEKSGHNSERRNVPGLFNHNKTFK